MKRKIFSIFFALVLVCSFSLVTAMPAGAADTPTIDGVIDTGEWDAHYLGTSVTGSSGGMSVDVYGFADDTYLYAAYVADISQPGWATTTSMGISANPTYWTPSTTKWPDEGHTILGFGGDGIGQTDGEGWNFEAFGGWEIQDGEWADIEYYVGDPCYNPGPNSNVMELKIPLSLLTYAGDNHFVGLSGQYWQYDKAEPFLVMLPPSPATVWVDDGWVTLSPGEAAEGHTFGYDAFATIQDGIDAVAEDGTVNVAAGTYVEQVTITESLMLVSIKGPEETTIDGAVEVRSADNVTISGFTVQNSNGSGIAVYTSNNCIITDINTSNDKYGIRLGQSSNCTITDVTANNNKSDGIFLNWSDNCIITNVTANNNNPWGIRLENSNNNQVHHSNIVGNTNGILNTMGTTVDATNNWWGTSDETLIAGMIEGAVDYSPWLPAPFDQVEEGAVDSADVSGSDPNEVDLKDDGDNTIAIVDISGASSGAEGTIIASRYSQEPTPDGTSLSVGTGKTGVAFLDVQVTGYTSGWAHITVPYDEGVVEDTLGLYYWDEAAKMWHLAGNSQVNTADKVVSGDIPVSALTGTPMGLGGYLEDEATVEIGDISVDYSGNNIVALTITTNTARLAAATIDVTFDNTVVEVLGGENGAFDSLTVNPSTARFVANQLGATGVDATGDGAVLAQVRLKAVGNTGSSSLLELTVITLKDNDGTAIPLAPVVNGTATIGGLGDANSDGAVDVYDCVYTARAIAGIPGYSVNNATMNVDGSDEVDAFDCTYLARHIAGIVGYEQLGG